MIYLFAVFVAIDLIILYFLDEKPLLQKIVVLATIVVYLLILQFFRNPSVAPIINDKHVLAPADGKVVAIEDTFEDEYCHEMKKQISIFMSPINVHVNRNPVSGYVKYFKYHKGKYLVAWHPKASSDNERTTVVIRTNGGIEILVRQIAGALAKRIKYYINEGDEVIQGNEFGFIKFGSRVDVFVPVSAKVNVGIGDKTKAGKTVIAMLE